MRAPEHTEQPRRRALTQAELVRAFVERMQASAGGEHSSVELARNARGDTQIKVTVRTGEHEGVETAEQAAAKAKEVYDLLRSFYPMRSPDDGKVGADG